MHEQLCALAAAQGGVVTTAQALAHHSRSDVRRLLRTGAWCQVRRGVYAQTRVLCESPPHLLAAAGLVLVSSGDVVLSHASAAALHRLPHVDPPVAPTLTLVRSVGTPARQPDGHHAAAVPPTERMRLLGLPLTTPARTVADLLRASADHADAVAVADAALRHGIPREQIAAVLAGCVRWPGVRRASEALAAADPRAESPLESRCRVWFLRQGLPEATPQVRVLGARGQVVARVDFLFRAQRTVCEADGRSKYDEPAALWREKKREDALRELGLEVVRATWADGEDDGRALAERLRRAFTRAAARPW